MERAVLRVLGSHSARRAQPRAGEATGLGRVPELPEWERAVGGWRSSPGEADLSRTARGGRELR